MGTLADVYSLIIYLLIFSVVLIAIAILILIEISKAERIAWPFLIGMFLYFLLMAFVNLTQMAAYIIDPTSMEVDPNQIAGIYNN